MNNKCTKTLLVSSIAACLIVEAAPVMAQLEEVVVFARKREETILQVPVTTTVLSENILDQYAVGDIKAIADKVAGLTFSTGNNSSGTRVFLRGVGTTTNNAAVDQSVALVSDGQQFTQGLAFRAVMFDMAQVEVFKGPQALFYGKAAPGGVISIRTADPGDAFEAIVRAGYEFEAEEKVGEFIVSGPVTDTLGLRLAGRYSDAEGYFNNAANPPVDDPFGAEAPGHDGFPLENFILRGTAVWEPSDRFNARFKATYVEDELQGTGTSSEQVNCPEGNLPAIPLPPPPFDYAPLAGNDCKRNKNVYKPGLDPAAFGDGRPRRNNADPFNKADQWFTSLELNWDVTNNWALTSLTGYYDVDQENIGEIAEASNTGNLVFVDGAWDRQDFTQEFRLTSDYSGALNYMVGGFYHDGKSTYNIDIPLNVAFQPLFGMQNFGWVDQTLDVEALSFFGQVLWDITPQLELGVGTRWTDEDRSLKPILLADPFYNPTHELIPIATDKIGGDNWSPEISLTYRPTDDLTLFANVKKAYKSGSFDTGGAPSPGEEVSFGDEKVQGAEIGIKSRMLDGRLVFNMAGYYQQFKDLQVSAQSLLDSGAIAVRTLNAAEAEIYGIDTDIAFTPEGLEGLTLFGALNWNKTEYTDFGNAPCWYGQLISEGCDQLFSEGALGPGTAAFVAQDLKGAPLIQAPEWSANVGFDYVRPVFEGMTFRLGSFVTYSSKYSAMIEDYWYQDDFFKLGATMGLSGRDDGWSVELIGNNLTDKLIVGQCSSPSTAETFIFGSRAPLNGTGTDRPGLAGRGETTCSLEPGRSVYLRLTLRLSSLLAN